MFSEAEFQATDLSLSLFDVVTTLISILVTALVLALSLNAPLKWMFMDVLLDSRKIFKMGKICMLMWMYFMLWLYAYFWTTINMMMTLKIAIPVSVVGYFFSRNIFASN